MIYDENAQRAKYWEDIAKQAFERIIAQKVLVEGQRKKIDELEAQIKFLEAMARK